MRTAISLILVGMLCACAAAQPDVTYPRAGYPAQAPMAPNPPAPAATEPVHAGYATVDGTVTRIVHLFPGQKGLAGDALRLTMRTPAGTALLVYAIPGPDSNLGQFPLRRGDRATVSGQMGIINYVPVLMADHLAAGGREVSLQPAEYDAYAQGSVAPAPFVPAYEAQPLAPEAGIPPAIQPNPKRLARFLALNSQIVGLPVENLQGQGLGIVTDTVLNRRSGRVDYVLILLTGPYETRNPAVAVPWAAVTVVPPYTRVTVDTTALALRAIAFDITDMPDLSSRDYANAAFGLFNLEPPSQYGYYGQ